MTSKSQRRPNQRNLRLTLQNKRRNRPLLRSPMWRIKNRLREQLKRRLLQQCPKIPTMASKWANTCCWTASLNSLKLRVMSQSTQSLLAISAKLCSSWSTENRNRSFLTSWLMRTKWLKTCWSMSTLEVLPKSSIVCSTLWNLTSKMRSRPKSARKNRLFSHLLSNSLLASAKTKLSWMQLSSCRIFSSRNLSSRFWPSVTTCKRCLKLHSTLKRVKKMKKAALLPRAWFLALSNNSTTDRNRAQTRTDSTTVVMKTMTSLLTKWATRRMLSQRTDRLMPSLSSLSKWLILSTPFSKRKLYLLSRTNSVPRELCRLAEPNCGLLNCFNLLWAWKRLRSSTWSASQPLSGLCSVWSKSIPGTTWFSSRSIKYSRMCSPQRFPTMRSLSFWHQVIALKCLCQWLKSPRSHFLAETASAMVSWDS